MKNAINLLLYLVIAILAIAYIFEKCSTPSSTNLNPPILGGVATIYDTLVIRDTIIRPITKTIYIRDTTNIITYRDRIVRDSVLLSAIPGLPDSVEIYTDSLVANEARLDYTILTQGKLIAFLPELQVYQRPYVSETKPSFISRKSLFEIGPVLGALSIEGRIQPAVGIHLGFGDVAGQYINYSDGMGILITYRKRF